MTDLELYLDSLGVRFNPDRSGGQSICCPYHLDRHASASLNLEAGLFFCFVCGIGGDLISLLMKQEGMTFAEAKAKSNEAKSAESKRGVEVGTGYRPRVTRTDHRRRRWR